MCVRVNVSSAEVKLVTNKALKHRKEAAEREKLDTARVTVLKNLLIH